MYCLLYRYTFIEFNSSIDATSARTKMHNAHVRGKRIQVHFDNKIPNQFRPNNIDDRDFLEPAISPPPPPPPGHLRRGSNESSVNDSQSHIASPQSSPGDRQQEYRRDRAPGGSSRHQPYYHDRNGDSYDSQRSVHAHSRNNNGYSGPDRRWNNNERTGGPMRTRPSGRYPAGSSSNNHYQRPYTRGPPPPHGASRYDNRGPRSYGRPAPNGRHYRESFDERREDYTPSHDSGYSPRVSGRSQSPARRSQYRDDNDNGQDAPTPYDEPTAWNEKDYQSFTPQRSRSGSRGRDIRRANSQVSLDLANDGGRWDATSPRDAAFNDDIQENNNDGDDLFAAAPEVRPKGE
ncbi:hypothetical protein LPJ57_001381 [Coemansia sp. RSA 486]|nr:hypothetical protein LPJ57_001381 [Coemansia sp. RSA 486]